SALLLREWLFGKPRPQQDGRRYAQVVAHQLRMGRGLVGEGARPRRRVDGSAAGVLHRKGQARVRVLDVPEGEVVQVIAEGEPARGQALDDFVNDAVVNEQAGQPAVATRPSQVAVERSELQFIYLRVANAQIVVGGQFRWAGR